MAKAQVEMSLFNRQAKACLPTKAGMEQNKMNKRRFYFFRFTVGIHSRAPESGPSSSNRD
jgi:hypothetical protein